MRNTFVKELCAGAAVDQRVTFITGDLGYGVVEPFAEAYPERFLNAGIAEQDMIGVAAGLAKEGQRVFVYSIGNFPTLRCLEQIRDCVCYHNLDVTIICVGAGYAYGQLGVTHHATEDIACMRSLPSMRVLSPADPVEASMAARLCLSEGGPAYVRLNKAHDPILPGSERLRNHSPSVIGSFVERVKSGCDVVFLATGSIASEALAATKLLAESGIACSLYTVPCVKPIDSSMIFRLAGSSKLIVTVEEHSVIGGLGSAVGELLLPMNTHAPILAIGIPDCYPEVVGDQTYLRHQFNMDAEAIARRSLEMLGDL